MVGFSYVRAPVFLLTTLSVQTALFMEALFGPGNIGHIVMVAASEELRVA